MYSAPGTFAVHEHNSNNIIVGTIRSDDGFAINPKSAGHYYMSERGTSSLSSGNLFKRGGDQDSTNNNRKPDFCFAPTQNLTVLIVQ